MRAPKNTRGFTLVEMMVVITIVSLVTAIALPNILASRKHANEANAVAQLKAIAIAQALFREQKVTEYGSWYSSLDVPRYSDIEELMVNRFLTNLETDTVSAFTISGGFKRKSGYRFCTQKSMSGWGYIISGIPDARWAPSAYGDTCWWAVAQPIVSGSTGDKIYAMNHTGMTYWRRPTTGAADGVALSYINWWNGNCAITWPYTLLGK
jgi:prepilin-type N-terminal cleavage/methylation domain-containing protein